MKQQSKQQAKQKEQQQPIYLQQDGLPTVTFSKTWQAQEGILGQLELSASGHTSKEALCVLEKLVQLSHRHDILCEARTKHASKPDAKCKIHLA